MSTPDLSLKESLQKRKVDPLQGVRHLAPVGASLNLRSLIPPPPPPGGGTGGGQPTWLRVDFQNLYTPDPLTSTPTLCSTTELFCQVDTGGAPVNAQGDPLVLGDSYWLGAVIHFPVTAPGFLMGRLSNQNLRFRVTARLPDGTAPTPDNTVWWREADEHDQGAPDQALEFRVRMPFWSSFLYGSQALRRGRKLSLAMCVESSQPFAPGQLGLEVRSEVGWMLLPDPHPPAHWGEGDTINFDTLYKCIFCIRCQRVVAVPPPDWNRCGICGSTGSLIMKPVAPEFVVASEPIGF